MPGLKLAFRVTLAAAASYAIYLFVEDYVAPPPPPPPPPPLPLPSDPFLALTLAVAACVIGKYFFGGKDDDAPPRDSYCSSSSNNRGTTRTWTQESYRPPPPSPSYTYRPPATYAYSQTAPWTSAPPDYSRGVHHIRTPSQTHLSSTLSDALAGVEDLEFAKKLRDKARRSGREMTEAYSRAKSAQRMGDRWAAQEHRQRADAHKSVMEELDNRAAKIIFKVNNKDRRDGMIDLHGLYVAEAVGFTNELLQSTGSRGDGVVRFIVGKGLHSDAGGAKIRPALEDLCTRQGLDHSLDPHNAGVLVVRSG